jgi:PAS domain S-box-containing protein
LDTAAEGIVTINERGKIQSFNPAAQKIFGYSASEVIGRDINMMMPSPHRESHGRFLAEYRSTGRAKVIGCGREVTGRRKDGTVFPMDLSVAEVNLAGGRVFTGFVRDVTRRREIEEALRRNEARLARAQEIAHLGSYEIEAGPGGISYWSPELFRILGLDPASKARAPDVYIRSLVHPDDRDRVRAALEEALREGTHYDVEYRIKRPDGSIRHVHSIAESVLGRGGRATRLLGMLQDISDRKALESEILRISEREQTRIGQDLHDGLCQHLAGIEFRLHSLKERLVSKAPAEARETAGLTKLVREGIEQTRTLAHGLSPIMLPADSLMGALAELAGSTQQAFHISCSFNCPEPVLIHDNTVATHLYRLAQEAVQNAIRHGRAKFIVINLLRADRRLVLGIKDDGIGLPRKPKENAGMGLRVMHHRASMIGGILKIHSNRESGTLVHCTVAIKPRRLRK